MSLFGSAPPARSGSRRTAAYARITHAQLARELDVTPRELVKIVRRNRWLGLTSGQLKDPTRVTYERDAVERLKLLRHVPTRTRAGGWLDAYRQTQKETHATHPTTPR